MPPRRGIRPPMDFTETSGRGNSTSSTSSSSSDDDEYDGDEHADESMDCSDSSDEDAFSARSWTRTMAVVETVFFPRRLPDKFSYADIHSQYNFYETSVLEIFADLNHDLLPGRIERMLRTWSANYRPSARSLRELGRGMRPGDFVPMYLPAQNAALMFLGRDDDLVDVWGFDVQPPAGIVVTAPGPLTVHQPRLCVTAPVSDVFSMAMAEQICCMQEHAFSDAFPADDARERQAPSSRYVLEWLFSVLAALQRPCADNADTRVMAVSKKIRDTVRHRAEETAAAAATSHPWRRNPAWMAFKFLLHTALTHCDGGHLPGTVVYKTAMLRFMTKLLENSAGKCDADHHRVEYADDAGVLQQMMAKISKRVHKLSCLVLQPGVSKRLAAKARKAMDHSVTVVEQVSSTQQTRWRSVVSRYRDSSQIAGELPRDRSVCLPLSASHQRIDALLGPGRKAEKFASAEMERHADEQALPLGDLLSSYRSATSMFIGLHAWEETLLQRFARGADETLPAATALSYLNAYRAATEEIYLRGDAIAQSRRLLVASVLMTMCDRGVLADYPLLTKHAADIDITPLKSILAADFCDMAALARVEKHFRRRQAKAKHPGPLQRQVTGDSLSVRFCDSSAHMPKRLEALLEADSRRENQHRHDARAAIAAFKVREQELQSEVCDKHRTLDEDTGEWIKMHLPKSCSKCREQKALRNRHHGVFERQLPHDSNLRQAAVFELCIPSDVENWRECVLVYNESYLHSTPNNRGQKSCRYDWVKHLSTQGTSPSRSIVLASKTSPQACAKRIQDARVDDFVQPCTLNGVLAKDKSPMPTLTVQEEAIHKLCTLDCGNGSLQPYLATTNHHQSRVIAEQGNCPEFFGVQEFVAFGSVRAGHLLQWFNILRGLHQRTLLLHRVEVVQLIAQSVWQAEESDCGRPVGAAIRNAHRPCRDAAFVREFTAELWRVLESVKANWAHHWSLCAVVILANRLLNLQDWLREDDAENDCVQQLCKILYECRRVAIEWLDKIRVLLQDVTGDSAGRLQRASAHIATFGTLTYSHSVGLLGNDDSPLLRWLLFVTAQHGNTVLNQSRVHGFHECLMKQALRTAYSMHSEFVTALSRREADGSHRELDHFIRAFYKDGRASAPFTVHTKNRLWVKVKWGPCGSGQAGAMETVQIDFREGQCFINGLPPDRLPAKITSSSLFSRHFGSTVFLVKPCTGPHEQVAQTTNAMTTGPVANSDGHDDGAASEPGRIGPFEFATRDRRGNEELCIYERRADGSTLLLLDQTWFSGERSADLPILLIEKHSFWIDIDKKKIFLRPVYFRDKGFADIEACDYVLDFNRQRLRVCKHAAIGVSPGSRLLDPGCPLGGYVLEVMQRIEQAQYVEMWLHGVRLEIRLPRLGLSFCISNITAATVTASVPASCSAAAAAAPAAAAAAARGRRDGNGSHDDSGSISSVTSDAIRLDDDSDWCVDTDQHIGTLLNLSSGLVLVRHAGEPYEERCFLLPHGKPKFSQAGRGKEGGVKIDLERLHEPSLLRFTVNRYLQQLQAPACLVAWLFLALLHGMTSSVHRDPFTGLTGMEMSMVILQSARCWSSSPLDTDCVQWLHSIARLSPARCYYPEREKLSQTVRWPAGIPSYCASDAYMIITDRILSFSGSLGFVYPDSDESRERRKLEHKLHGHYQRDLYVPEYMRHCDHLPLLARLQTAYVVDFKTSETPAFPDALGVRQAVLSSTRRVMRRDGASAAVAVSADALEGLLLETNADGTHMIFRRNFDDDDDDNDDDDDGEGDSPLPSSCREWTGIELPKDFMALHGYISARKDSTYRCHLSLMLSFLHYTDKHNRKLLHLLEGIAVSSSDVDVPGLREYPKSAPKDMPSYTYFLSPEKYITSEVTFLKRHGPRPLRMGTFASESEKIEYQRLRKDVRCRYQQEMSSIKQAIEKDVKRATGLLADGPHFYFNPLPPDLPMKFRLSDSECINDLEYQKVFHSQLTSVNAARILRLYVEDVIRLIGRDGPSRPLSRQQSRRGIVSSCSVTSIAERLLTQNTQVHIIKAADDSSGVHNYLKGRVHDNAREQTGRKRARHEGIAQRTWSNLEDVKRKLHDEQGSLAVRFAKSFSDSVTTLDRFSADEGKLPESERGLVTSLRQAITNCDKKRRCVQDMIVKSTATNRGLQAMHACGLLARDVPLMLLLQLQPHGGPTTPELVRTEWLRPARHLIGAWAECMVVVQRWARIVRLRRANETDLLRREWCNPPHASWAPCRRDEWLLFELENDVCIWKQQVDVAERMINPGSADGHHHHQQQQHVVMQLNMGEGKTAVILPIIAAQLADGQSLVRIIVLTSLLNTNFNQLVFKLGGLLNHRVFSLPVRRDVPITVRDAERLEKFLRVARQRRNVMVTVREHVLSLRLKYLEASYSGDLGLAEALGNVMRALAQYARDVLDEADEVLHHRFQLVYPLGQQQPLDGKEVRWEVAQLVLMAVKERIGRVHEQFAGGIDCTQDDQLRQKFPTVRILESSSAQRVYLSLCEEVVDFIFSGVGNATCSELRDQLQRMSREERRFLNRFLLSENLGKEAATRFQATVPRCITPLLLVLRGLLATSVLKLALTKRYRVEYGLVSTTAASNTSRDRRSKGGGRGSGRICRMAVPFRAKDVAAERTEFGHPDVAIVLTLISYYQHGLTRQQMDIALDKLAQDEAKKSIWARWVQSAAPCAPQAALARGPCTSGSGARGDTEHGYQDEDLRGIQDYDGVNRHDPKQMSGVVFPFLRYHMDAINFFLNSVVFPGEAKEFASKLVANAWTMTSKRRKKLVTGFSGTSDTQDLLPNTTVQRNLPELQHTDAYVCSLVLKDANNCYHSLPAGCDGAEFINTVVKSSRCPARACTAGGYDIDAIIDAGALVLDLPNERLAELWLQQRPDKQGVVYFGDADRLCVRQRGSRRACQLELSPYASDLGKCLVYLDHAHCRGTDLRMVENTRAAVTLGKNLRRDELVQACMRMRRLSSSHSVSFWATQEADTQIRHQLDLRLEGRQIQHKHVLLWSCLNSINATKAAFYSWASQGLVHLRTEQALALCDSDRRVGEQCRQPDCQSLRLMYGCERSRQPVSAIIRQKGRDVAGAKEVIRHCERLVPNVERFAQELSEEQERELEQETEEERQRQLPPAQRPVDEVLPDYLRTMAQCGSEGVREGEGDLVQIWKCFADTSLSRSGFSEVIPQETWSCSANLWATESFRRTVETARTAGGNRDAYIRPVEWLLLTRQPRNDAVIVLISPYQANRLLGIHNEDSASWSKSTSLLMHATTNHKTQSIMSDWQFSIAGRRPLPPLSTCSVQQKAMFAELLCFSGGLFFGPQPVDEVSMMSAIAHVFCLKPGPAGTSGTTVSYTGAGTDALPPCSGDISTVSRRRARNPRQPSGACPIEFLRRVYAVLRSGKSLELSDMGSLLLRRCWPRADGEHRHSASADL
eukprot:scpid17040/ scgid32574/ 